MLVSHIIRKKLTSQFNVTELEIIDESHLHKGHSGARPTGESHFKIRIVAKEFSGKSRLERQRMIYSILADELRDHIHALSIDATSPDHS